MYWFGFVAILSIYDSTVDVLQCCSCMAKLLVYDNVVQCLLHISMKLPIQCFRNDIFALSFCNQEINQIDTYAYTFPKDIDSIAIYICRNAMCQQQCQTLSRLPYTNNIGIYQHHSHTKTIHRPYSIDWLVFNANFSSISDISWREQILGI